MYIKTKYNGELNFDLYKQHTIKNIFKVLPLKDEGKDWERYLEGLLVELSGFDSLSNEVNFESLLAKLQGLFKIPVEKAWLFRKTVFDSIDLLKKIEPQQVIE